MKVTGIRPHPAFDLSVLPSFRHGTAPLSAFHEQKPIYKTHRQTHYPTGYLERLKPLEQTIDGFCDVVAYVVMLAVAWGSALFAVLNPFWTFDSQHLNAWAFFSNPDQTVFLRRVIVLEGLAWTHGLAVAYSAHLRGILRNKAKLELVVPMMGEFHSHRVHILSLLQALKPAIFTRVLIVVLAAVTLPIYFGLCVVYLPMCHSLAKFIGGLAVRLYSTALDDMDAGHMPRLTELHAPIIAQWFYGLGPSASIRDVFLCIRADDVFHTMFNEVCYETSCSRPLATVEPLLDLKDEHAKGQ